MSRRVCRSRDWKKRQAAARGLRPPSPARGAALAGSVFHGELYLVNVLFQGPGMQWSLSAADVAVALQYLQHAAAPIAAYASQYGPAALTVRPSPIAFGASIANGQYSDAQLQNWVNALVRSQKLGPNSALLFLNPPGPVNTDAKESGGVGVLGYHGKAAVPYAFVNVVGTGFTLDDASDLYAEALSHEVAELTVDPGADGSNPEVCDGCGTNCQGSGAFRAFFDSSGGYLGTRAAFPPGYSYAFFLSAIARPLAATDCPAPETACAYAPP